MGDILTQWLFLSYLAAQANGILYWAKRWHVCLAAFSTFWAVCRHKAKQHTKSIRREQNTKTTFIRWPASRLQSATILRMRGPCLYQTSWCTARRCAWCHSAALSLYGPPGRYLHEGWSLRRYPAGRKGTEWGGHQSSSPTIFLWRYNILQKNYFTNVFLH